MVLGNTQQKQRQQQQQQLSLLQRQQQPRQQHHQVIRHQDVGGLGNVASSASALPRQVASRVSLDAADPNDLRQALLRRKAAAAKSQEGAVSHNEARISAAIDGSVESWPQRGRFNSEATSISPGSLECTEGEGEDGDDETAMAGIDDALIDHVDERRGNRKSREDDSKVFTFVWWMLYPMFLLFFLFAGEILPAMQEGVLRASRVFLRRRHDNDSKHNADELLIEDEDEDEDTDGTDTVATTPNTPAGSSSCRSPATRGESLS